MFWLDRIKIFNIFKICKILQNIQNNRHRQSSAKMANQSIHISGSENVLPQTRLSFSRQIKSCGAGLGWLRLSSERPSARPSPGAALTSLEPQVSKPPRSNFSSEERGREAEEEEKGKTGERHGGAALSSRITWALKTW